MLNIIGINSEGDWYVTASGAWIAAFLVDDVPEGLPVAEAAPRELTAVPRTPTPPPVSPSIVAHFPSLLGSKMPAVETVLGDPEDIIPLYPGDMLRYSGSGHARSYYFGRYYFYAFYDEVDVLRGLQIFGGLDDMGFTIDEWREVLALVGLPTTILPDEEYLVTRRWNNLGGYFVEIGSLGPDPSSPIWGIMVWINE